MIVKEPTGCEKQTCCDILELEKRDNPIAPSLRRCSGCWENYMDISPYAGNVPSYMAEKTLA